jgi:hypothetical protein
MSRHTKAHTFASRTSQRTDQSLQKSVLFASPNRNSIFFSPALRCFNFFCHRTVRNLTDSASNINRFLDSVCKLDTTHLRTDRRATDNKGFKKLAAQWLNQVQFSNQSFVQVDSFVLRNRQLLKPPKRCGSCPRTKKFHRKRLFLRTLNRHESSRLKI